jgi:hypothetical protein
MRPNLTAALALSVLALSVASFAAEPVPCAQLLTAAEVESAVGSGFQNLGQESSEPGKSGCMWLRESTPNPKAIQLRFQQGTTGLPELFEAQAKKAEDLHGNKREALSGIGVKAAMVPGAKPGAMIVVVVQTKEGVAYLETDYIEPARAVALAKAIVTK